MPINLPKISRLIYEANGNEVWQCFGGEQTLYNIQFVSTNPFVIEGGGINYLLTSNIDDNNIAEHDYVLMTSKKPIRKDVNANHLNIKRWLKHPSFVVATPDQVVASWKDKFNYIKENEEANIKGLRPPQMGALHSILAHIQNPEDQAIVVMPTGTGKTETMLATLIANECKKILVSVPSDSLRSQISNKFITLGLLKEFGIVNADCLNPIVGILKSGFQTPQELQDFTSKCNVVVSTMDLLTGCTNAERTILKDIFHIFLLTRHIIQKQKLGKNLLQSLIKKKFFYSQLHHSEMMDRV